MRYGLTPVEEVRAVEQGKADWTADSVPGTLMPEVTTRFPAQWHSLQAPETDWLQLNTHIAPFNDIRVRKALNLAIDRGAVVRLFGGSAAATATCQVLPPEVTGYRRYCPYPRDLARARRLVAASGTGGEQITLSGVTGGGVINRPVIGYTTRVLRELGYRARARFHPLGYYFNASPKAWRRMQIDSISGEDTTPLTFFANSFGCNGPTAHFWYCDRRFDDAVQQAHRFETTDARAARLLWTKIDREVVDRAFAVPLVNEHLFDFFSARVNGYVSDPILGLIVDQVSLR